MEHDLKRKTTVIGHRNPDTDSICSATALLEDIVVEVGQDGTVEAHGVFYQEYHLHACLPDIGQG